MSPRRKSARPEIPAMTRSELIIALADQQGVSRLEAERVVEVFFGTIQRALEAGDRVELRGFGTFQPRSYGGYTGRNPATGAQVSVAPKVLPVFRLGRELQDRLLLAPSARPPLPPPPKARAEDREDRWDREERETGIALRDDPRAALPPRSIGEDLLDEPPRRSIGDDLLDEPPRRSIGDDLLDEAPPGPKKTRWGFEDLL